MLETIWRYLCLTHAEVSAKRRAQFYVDNEFRQHVCHETLSVIETLGSLGGFGTMCGQLDMRPKPIHGFSPLNGWPNGMGKPYTRRVQCTLMSALIISQEENSIRPTKDYAVLVDRRELVIMGKTQLHFALSVL